MAARFFYAKHFDAGSAETAAERPRPQSTRRVIGQPRITLHPAGEALVPPEADKPKKARRRKVKK